ncbi:ABR148C-Ap [Eremothecium gossypii ATCC 10895]|uniref:ABR148C-Ap n=1 Tax=Eremothecium gossypii (strain ATCC 10895 / CBS 109.51 / FGSC 9923 / NRRL Y-1056) TaxID=284811 RepID=Q75D75_EREGS|nr:ABR148C-Ap [Eremothecium gossypii ATCC 10895]AAS50920.2 ABR148C-Ap [Eremothecium gossypii ATCC 10895]
MELSGLGIRWRYFGLLCATGCVAVFLGITTDKRFNAITAEHDKAAHFAVFALESWLFTRSIVTRHVAVPGRWLQGGDVEQGAQAARVSKYWVAGLACGAAAAVLSEVAQHVVSRGRRVFDVWDVACNAAGALVGVGAAWWRERR